MLRIEHFRAMALRQCMAEVRYLSSDLSARADKRLCRKSMA
jgi:hypothetical protein